MGKGTKHTRNKTIPTAFKHGRHDTLSCQKSRAFTISPQKTANDCMRAEPKYKRADILFICLPPPGFQTETNRNGLNTSETPGALATSILATFNAYNIAHTRWVARA